MPKPDIVNTRRDDRYKATEPIASPKTKPRKMAPTTKAENPTNPTLPSPHGTVQRYRRHGCRCSACVTAQREAKRVERTGSVEVQAKPERQHGTRSCYVGGCRLPECVEANRTYQREWVAAKRARFKS